jgi:hypothetical protein
MAMKWTWFELRYGLVFPFWGVMLIQYVALFWLAKRVPRPVLYIPAAIFIVENFFFQVVVGTLLFLERPRDLQFTGRIKRMTEAGDERAERFKRVLNESDPGHV